MDASEARTCAGCICIRDLGASASQVVGQTPHVVHFSTAGQGRLDVAERAFRCSLSRKSCESPVSTMLQGKNSSYGLRLEV